MKKTEVLERSLSSSDRAKRKRYLSATLITCLVLLMIGGTLHVVKLGSIRMQDMRKLATYDLKEEQSKIRAAGEDIALHELNEANKNDHAGYTIAEIDKLLPEATWKDLDSMITVPAGSFKMGTDSERANSQDRPQHQVTLPAFRIDKYPVTNAQYAKFVVATLHRPPLDWKSGKIPSGEAMRPVTMVSWFDATAYAKWAGKRLPTEAEWEKAARGTDGRRWPWGNTMEPKRLNTYYNVGSATDVNSYPSGASIYGVMDMAGNVDEWVEDDFTPYPGSDAPPGIFQAKVPVAASEQDKAMKVSEMMPTSGMYKVLRGGSWKSDPFSTQTFHRDAAWPNYASDFYGFRCASDAGKASGK